MAVLNTEKLIEEIEKRPAIWDVTSEEHSDRFIRRKNWQEIVDIFVDTEVGEVNAIGRRELENALMKKWKCIRGCFTRELGRQRAVQSGKNPGPRKSQYVYFNQLQFLTKSIKVRSKESWKRERSDSTTSVSSQEHAESDVDQTTKRVKKEITEFEAEDDPLQYLEMSNTSVPVERTQDPYEHDEDKMFLMSLLSTMKKVPENKRLSTRIKIMKVLEEAIL